MRHWPGQLATYVDLDIGVPAGQRVASLGHTAGSSRGRPCPAVRGPAAVYASGPFMVARRASSGAVRAQLGDPRPQLRSWHPSEVERGGQRHEYGALEEAECVGIVDDGRCDLQVLFRPPSTG